MEFAAMNVVGPLPETVKGNKYILVFSDYHTRLSEAYAIYNQKAKTKAKIFVKKIVFRFVALRKLLTDQGKNFMSELLKEICKLFSIMKIKTFPYRPQTDGLVERFNETLQNMLES